MEVTNVVEPNELLLISISEPNAEWVLVWCNRSKENPRYDLFVHYGPHAKLVSENYGETWAGEYGRILGYASLRECLKYVADTCGENLSVSWRQIPPGMAWFNWTPEDHKWWYTYGTQLVEVAE